MASGSGSWPLVKSDLIIPPREANAMREANIMQGERRTRRDTLMLYSYRRWIFKDVIALRLSEISPARA